MRAAGEADIHRVTRSIAVESVRLGVQQVVASDSQLKGPNTSLLRCCGVGRGVGALFLNPGSEHQMGLGALNLNPKP